MWEAKPPPAKPGPPGESVINIKVNAHNAVLIIGIAILGIVLMRLGSKTKLGKLPVIGDALRVGAVA